MQDQFEHIKQEPGFPELVTQAWELAEIARGKVEEAKAEYESALKTLHRYEEGLNSAVLTLDRILDLGERLGFPRDLVEAFCRQEITRSKEQASPDSSTKRRLPNAELMILVAEIIAEKNRPVTLVEILEGLEALDVLLPGRAPEKNLLAYISRSPLIKSVKRGWYDYDPLLLDAAKRQVRERNQ